MDPIKWGTVSGKEVFLFTLESKGGLKMLVTNYGAIVQSLFVPCKGKSIDVVLGYNSLEGYVKDPFYIGCVAGRFAGRIANSEIHIDEKKYSLSKNHGDHQLHGGVEGFNKKVFTVDTVSGSSIRLSYSSRDSEEGFPGNLHVTVMYTLTDDNEWIVEYEATTDKPTVINLTQHAYFNLSGSLSSPITDHEIQIHADWFVLVDEKLISTGAFNRVKNSPFDFTSLKPISDLIEKKDIQLSIGGGYDHTWVLEHQAETLKKAATVYHSATGLKMEVETTEPGIHFYSGNFLKTQTLTKDGQSFERRTGFCLETQHFPDSPNHSNFPSTLLVPEQTFRSKTIYRFS